jgi:hypothetical protein
VSCGDVSSWPADVARCEFAIAGGLLIRVACLFSKSQYAYQRRRRYVDAVICVLYDLVATGSKLVITKILASGKQCEKVESRVCLGFTPDSIPVNSRLRIYRLMQTSR